MYVCMYVFVAQVTKVVPTCKLIKLQLKVTIIIGFYLTLHLYLFAGQSLHGKTETKFEYIL